MRDMERSIPRIRERIARLEQLTDSIEGLRRSVDTLTETYNKGRGAIWMIGGFGALIALFAKWLVTRYG
jgi:prefoldin subunit 5